MSVNNMPKGDIAPTVHQQFKATDRHQDRQWQRDWGGGQPVCGGLTRGCGEPPLSVAAVKQHVKPAGNAMHHTRSPCITCIALPFVAFEIGPLLVQYDNALTARCCIGRSKFDVSKCHWNRCSRPLLTC